MFRTLLSFLLPSRFPEEKMSRNLPDMSEPEHLVPSIIDITAFDNSICNFVKTVLLRVVLTTHLRDIDDCVITLIEHYRSEDKLHEFIMATILFRTGDKRYVRLERFKVPDDKPRGGSKSEYSLDLLSSISGRGTPTLARDCMVIHDQKDKMFDGTYTLARSFSPPHKSFTILDLTFLGSTIALLSSEYSKLHHMCFWWAASFFTAAHEIVAARIDSRPDIHKGQAYTFMGKFLNVPLVSNDGTFLFQSPIPSAPTLYVNELMKHFTAQGMATSALDTIKSLAVAEIDVIMQRGTSMSVAAIIGSFTQYHDINRTTIEKKVKELQDTKDQFAIISETNDHLTTANDHLTTTNDHLTTTNDHLTTTNDHLTTTNDHLTTTNDHLTTTNDHLTTANEHLATERDEAIANTERLHELLLSLGHKLP